MTPSIRRIALAVACGFAIPTALFPPPTRAQSTQPTTQTTIDPQLLATLTAMDAKVAQVHDLVANFEQRKITPLLKKPLVSTGRVRIKGSTMRWDTTKPHPSVMVIDAREIRLYYPQQSTLEIYALAQQIARLAASPLPRLPVLREHFTFVQIPAETLQAGDRDPHHLALELTPIDASLREHVQRVRVLLDTESAHIVTMEMLDADGDRTIVSFRDVKTNVGLPEAELDLAVPPGTTVTRPLEAFEAPQNR